MQRRQVVAVLARLVQHRQRHGRDQQHIGGLVVRDRTQRIGRVEPKLRYHRTAHEHRRQQALDITVHVVHRQREHDAPGIFEGTAVGAAEGGAQHHVVREHHTLG